MATVLLYAQTKDRWRWRVVVKRVTLVACAPVVLGLMWLGYEYVRGRVEARPRTATQYSGVSLGDSQDDVLYAKGSPIEVLEDDGNSGFRVVVDLAGLPSRKVTDYSYWDYESADSGRVDVDFSPQTKKVVRVFCYAKERECPSLLGVSAGTTEDEVIAKLGRPSRAHLRNATKILEYSQYNAAFYLTQRRVYGIQLGVGERDAQRPTLKSVGWTQESTGTTEVGPWLSADPPGTRYCRMADGTIYRLYPPGIRGSAEKANVFCLAESTTTVRAR